MYFEIVNNLLMQSVQDYATNTCQTKREVLLAIREHIDHTHEQYWKETPEINYNNPLCRLGYLYRYVAANATLIEWMLTKEQERINLHQDTLNLCALGGGPGTELLGIVKHLIKREIQAPPRIVFSVLDNIPQWADIWNQLKEAAVTQFGSKWKTESPQRELATPTVEANFLPFDVFNHSSYQDYAFLFRNVDVVICNYVFSENKTKLNEAQQVIEHLVGIAKPECLFIVIDRLEQNTNFKTDIVNLFETACNADITLTTFDEALDSDEQKEVINPLIIEILGQPRLRFFMPGSRLPGAFGFATKHNKGANIR